MKHHTVPWDDLWQLYIRMKENRAKCQQCHTFLFCTVYTGKRANSTLLNLHPARESQGVLENQQRVYIESLLPPQNTLIITQNEISFAQSCHLTKPCRQKNYMWHLSELSAATVLSFKCFPSIITLSPADTSSILSYKCVRGKTQWLRLIKWAGRLHTPFQADPHAADSCHRLGCSHRSMVMQAALQYLERDKELWCHHCCL